MWVCSKAGLALDQVVVHDAQRPKVLRPIVPVSEAEVEPGGQTGRRGSGAGSGINGGTDKEMTGEACKKGIRESGVSLKSSGPL